MRLFPVFWLNFASARRHSEEGHSDTTSPIDRSGAASPDGEAGAPEIEVTPAMIEAGVDAYYENAIWGWENPGREQLKEMVRAIFSAMWCDLVTLPIKRLVVIDRRLAASGRWNADLSP
jgi:hypothetical protein